MAFKAAALLLRLPVPSRPTRTASYEVSVRQLTDFP